MEQDIITMLAVTHPDGTLLRLFSRGNTTVIKNAQQSVELNSTDTVSITVVTAVPLSFYIGDRITVFNRTYTLNQPPTIKKTGTRNFEYGLTFEGVQYELLDVQWLLPAENTVLDSFTGTLKEFLEFLVDNANRVYPDKWALGEYPEDTDYMTLTYAQTNCLEVLQDLCEQYGVEFEITEGDDGIRTINVRDEVGTDFNYVFEYGRTGGLYQLERKNADSSGVITRLYIYGGTQNLGNSYRYNKLCLPDKEKNDSYLEDEAAVAKYGLREGSVTFEDDYPNRYGEVTAIVEDDVLSFIDDTMEFDLNEMEEDGETTKWLINGTDAKIQMVSGNLAGYEFTLHAYDHETHKFTVVQMQDENENKFPSDDSAAFQFAVGDKYIITDINVPQEYIDEAEAKLLEDGTEEFNTKKQPAVTYSLSIARNFIEKYLGKLDTDALFAVGDYVPVLDDDMDISRSMRVTAFTRDLLDPYTYTLTLGDSKPLNIVRKIIGDFSGWRNSDSNVALTPVDNITAADLRDLLLGEDGKIRSDLIAAVFIDDLKDEIEDDLKQVIKDEIADEVSGAKTELENTLKTEVADQVAEAKTDVQNALKETLTMELQTYIDGKVTTLQSTLTDTLTATLKTYVEDTVNAAKTTIQTDLQSILQTYLDDQVATAKASLETTISSEIATATENMETSLEATLKQYIDNLLANSDTIVGGDTTTEPVTPEDPVSPAE